MPLTSKGRKIMSAMKGEYGEEKGERVFYASRNKGTISGVDPESREKKPAKKKAGTRGHRALGMLAAKK